MKQKSNLLTRMAIGENAYRFFPKHYAELHSWRVRRDLAATGTAAGVSGMHNMMCIH